MTTQARFNPSDTAHAAYVRPRVLELVCTADVMVEKHRESARRGARQEAQLSRSTRRPPFRWHKPRRAQFDGWFARAYGLTRDELRSILARTDVHGPGLPGETFRVHKEEELAKYGEYRTRRLVLAAWDCHTT